MMDENESNGYSWIFLIFEKEKKTPTMKRIGHRHQNTGEGSAMKGECESRMILGIVVRFCFVALVVVVVVCPFVGGTTKARQQFLREMI